MSGHVVSNSLLKEAQTLERELQESFVTSDLLDKVRGLGTKLRAAKGLVLIEQDYHKAVKIYDEILMMEDVFDSLGLEETNPIFYNHNLAE